MNNDQVVKSNKLFSHSGVSNFYFHYSSGTLFDCGEGVASTLRNLVYRVNRICFTHSHYDHVGGFRGFLLMRTHGMGANEKPLRIFIPDRDQAFLARLSKIIEEIQPSFEITIHRVAGTGEEVIEIGNPTAYIVPFRATHNNMQCVNYSLVRRITNYTSEGRRLIDEKRFTDIKDHHKFDVPVCHMAYMLDCSSLSPKFNHLLRDAKYVIADTTFLHEEDRNIDEPGHMTIDEVDAMRCALNIKSVFAAHVSHRYGTIQIDRIQSKFPEITIVPIGEPYDINIHL